MVTSEQSGFCQKVKSYITLQNDDICIISNKNKEICIQYKESYIEKNVNIPWQADTRKSIS